MVLGDRIALRRALVNLLSNAVRLAPEGSTITLGSGIHEGRAWLSVADEGPGIAAEDRAKVFQRFYSERPAGDFGNNSGLGLAISKQIVEAHGGVIWAENIRPSETDPTSEPLGARFVVGLPV